MRTFLFSTFSALAAALVTWLVLHPPPAPSRLTAIGKPPGLQDGATLLAGAAIQAPNDLATHGRKPDRWQNQRSADGKIPASAMGDVVQGMVMERDPLLAMEAFSALLRELTPGNAAAAWEAMSTRFQGAEALRYLPLLAHAWGAMDGPAAMAAMKSGGDRHVVQARMSAMGGWATRDSTGALAWLKEQELGAKTLTEGKAEALQELRMVKAGLIKGLAAADPQRAMGLVSAMDEKERGPMVALVAREQFRLGIDAAAQWAGSISDPALQEQAMGSLVRHYADADPAKAAAWLSGQKGLSTDPRAFASVAREWVAQDPGAAVKWLGDLPEGPVKNEAWEDAVRSWSKRDPLASSTYLAQMPGGSSRDSAVSSLSRSIARSDPDAAIQWAQSIQDPAARSAALVRSVQLWSSKDQAAASQWIESSNLMPDIQQQMMEPLNGKARKDMGKKGGNGQKVKLRQK